MKTTDPGGELWFNGFSPRAVPVCRYGTAYMVLAGLMALAVTAWTQPPPTGPILPTGPSIPPIVPSIPPIVPRIPEKLPKIPETQPWTPHFVPRVVATPQPGGPCGLQIVDDPKVVVIKPEARADGPFKVTLSWSGQPGRYNVKEEGGPFEADVEIKPKPYRLGSTPSLTHGETRPASCVHEPALPDSKHSYVIKAQWPDGTTACGTASVITPPTQPIKDVNGKYADVRHVTLKYHIPPYVTAVRVFRQPRLAVELLNPFNADILIKELKGSVGQRLNGTSKEKEGSWTGDPGPPPFPYANGQYDKSAANYPFILEAVWTKWPDGSGERVSTRTPVSVSGPAPIVGYADLHAHMFSYLGFGGNPSSFPKGRHFWGKAFGAIDEALPWCTPQHGPGGTGDLGNYIMQIATVGHVPPNTGHAVGGNPLFDGWPRWNSFTHQQYYEDWLKRAHDKGLKLVVTHPVNNEWMCTTLNHTSTADAVTIIAALSSQLAAMILVGTIPEPSVVTMASSVAIISALVNAALGEKIAYWQTHIDESCLDKDAAQNQINEAFAMQDDIDMRVGDGHGNTGPGTGWFRVVRTPKEARDVIAAGKLAVVIGMEVDNPFECTVNNTSCPEEFMRSEVDRYYNLGVRHFFPIHFYDNAFGGSANSNLLVTNQLGNPMAKRNCSGSGFQYDSSQCNDKGLTLLGRQLIIELMKHGMIIDIDHMSEKAFNDTMTIAGDNRYPVVSSHSGFTAISNGGENNEGNRTPRQILEMINLGGMFAVIPHQENTLGEMSQVASTPEAIIDYKCGNSSQSVAQAYRYARDHVRGGPVGFGTDLNGFAGWPSPRFGPEACSGGGNSDGEPMLAYPATIQAPGVSIPVEQCVVGGKTYDFNFDGFAHIGMLPDMIADFEAMGMQPSELDALFFSAEGYIRLWERADYMRKQ